MIMLYLEDHYMCFQDVKVLNFDNFLGERRGRVVGHRPVNVEVGDSEE